MQYKATTLSGWWSIFKKFWLYAFPNAKLLERSAVLVLDKLKLWEKKERIRQSGTFTAKEIQQWLDSPDTPHNLVMKFYFCIGLPMAGRGCEIQAVQRRGVRILTRDDGVQVCEITFHRRKQGSSIDVERHCVTRGTSEMRVIHAYLATFKADDDNERLIRYLKTTKEGNVYRPICPLARTSVPNSAVK